MSEMKTGRYGDVHDSVYMDEIPECFDDYDWGGESGEPIEVSFRSAIDKKFTSVSLTKEAIKDLIYLLSNRGWLKGRTVIIEDEKGNEQYAKLVRIEHMVGD